MADNYLERRMDDLRNGRLQQSNKIQASVSQRKGYLSVNFPMRRVLVTGGANGIGLAVTRAFLKAGCKVAVMDIDREKGEKLAHDEGVRFYNVDLADKDALEKALDNLFSAWKDLDIVVSNAGISTFQPLTEGASGDF